nr:cadherin-like domain-containing protein [Aeromonas hydrophila]
MGWACQHDFGYPRHSGRGWYPAGQCRCSYQFTPATNYDGPVPAVSYTVTDGTDSVQSILTITITLLMSRLSLPVCSWRAEN